MKTRKLMKLIPAVLLSVLLFVLPVMADESPDTGTLKVPTDSGQTDVTAESVYTYGPKAPGVQITARDQSVSAAVSGDISALYGGVDMETSGSGKVNLEAGCVRGGFGVLAYINGGQIEGTVDSIIASGDTALEAVLSRSGSFHFTANSISSFGDAVMLETGADFSGHISDPETIEEPEDPGDDGWDVIEDDEWSAAAESSGKNASSEGFLPGEGKAELSEIELPVSGSMTAKDGGGSDDVVIKSESIDAGGTAVDITLSDARKVSLEAEEITAEGSGMLVELSEEGGTVTLTSPVIDADEQGLVINAPAGTVQVTAEDYIGGLSAAEVFNNGADVTLDAGLILGGSGLFIESTAGTTVENTEDIVIDNYGIYVHTHDAVDERTFDPTESTPEGSGSESSKDSPAVKVTVEGDISDNYEFPEEPEDEYELPPDVPLGGDKISAEQQSEMKGIAKDGDEETGDENEASSAGITVQAETAGTVDIIVSGGVFTDYGAEIDADNGAEVSVSVQDDVTTAYGNSLSADNADVELSVGGSINSGGIALDTLASSDGVLEINIGEDIYVDDSYGVEDPAGIYANSMDNGITRIEVNGGISVLSENDAETVYGIFTENTGGEITISVGDDVKAAGANAAGMVIINGADSEFSEIGGDDAPAVKTDIEIMGDLTGESTGLYVDGTGSTTASVFVEGTIGGDEAGVVISEETAPENVDLTAWKIVLKNGKAVTGGTQAAAVENDAKYLIKYAPDDLEGRVLAVDGDGAPLPETHGYQYAKNGEMVYFRPSDGDIEAIYNGMESRASLRKEADGSFSLRIPAGGGVWISSGPAPEPEGPGAPIDFYPIDGLLWLSGTELPGTGFSASHVTPLPARPHGLTYTRTGFTLQIPSLDVVEEIMTVPRTDGGYPVDWLGSSVGLLEESSLPGDGITVLTGHNHLNTTETGPFLFIKTLETGDRIMVTDEDGTMLRYSVYGNYRIASDDFDSLAGELRSDSLVLITCEDESIDGGYINRRVIFAELVG